MILVLLLGLFAGAGTFIGLTWISAEIAWRRLNPLQQREVLMNEPVVDPSVGSPIKRLYRWAARRGFVTTLDETLLTVTGIYLSFLLAGAVFSISPIVTSVCALPGAVVVTISRNRRRIERVEAELRSQLLTVFESLAGMIEGGDTVPGAVSKLAGRVEEPLRGELIALSNSYAVRSSLVPGLRSMIERHPSRPLRLLLSAVEVDEELGVRLVPVLRQAGAMLERDHELAAESLAELSQARSEFVGISVVIAGVAVMMAVGARGATGNAYATPLGLIGVSVGVANYLWGISRTLKIFRKAKEASV